jgi:DNA-directed RNA polymerase specialized sigma24 family protein
VTAQELERLAREQRATLIAAARRRCRTREDAEDAVQQALAILFVNRARIRRETALGYLCVTASHEALRLHREAREADSLDQLGAAGISGHELIGDPRRPVPEELLDTLAALRTLKRDQARALVARGLGWRYQEIAAAFGWSYTKTNRCVTEGRAAVRRAVSTGERPATRAASGDRRRDACGPIATARDAAAGRSRTAAAHGRAGS